MSQAARMEHDLEYLRKLKQDAYDAQDPNRVVTLTRVILQGEISLAKQKVHELKTLDAKVVEDRRDQIAKTMIAVAKRWITDKETYDNFVDDLLAELAGLWEVV